jgi:hypothetical protein
LLTQPDIADRPALLTVTDRSAVRLDRLRALQERINAAVPVTYCAVDGPQDNDALPAALSPGSLLVNATGLGKDRPGSPLSDATRFPERGDGWRYFILGWTAAIAEVFERPISPADLDAPTAAAAFARPASPPLD